MSKRLASLAGIGILCVAALELLRRFSHAAPTPIAWRWILVSLIFHVGIYWLSAQGWIRILAEMGEAGQSQEHLTNYWDSLPLQFIGGFAGIWLGRLWLSKSLTVKNKTLASALVVEKSLNAICSLLGLTTLTALSWVLGRYPGIFVPFTGALLLLILGSIGSLYASTYSHSPSASNKTAIALVYLGGLQACDILALVALTKAVGLASPREWVLVSRAYMASWSLGQLAFIIPQGLGIREALFAYFVRSSAGIVWPLTYALYARLLSIAGQLVPILFLRGRAGRLVPTDREHSLPPAQ